MGPRNRGNERSVTQASMESDCAVVARSQELPSSEIDYVPPSELNLTEFDRYVFDSVVSVRRVWTVVPGKH